MGSPLLIMSCAGRVFLVQEGDAKRTNRASISAVKAQQANLQSSNPLLKVLQVLLPLLVILAAIFVPKYLL